MDIAKLLEFAHQQDASDLHISAGEPPMVRVHGDMKKLKVPALTADQTQAMLYDIMNDGQRKQFEEFSDCDFAMQLGDAARFRVNVFRQNRGVGAVFRKIPTRIMTIGELNLPSMLVDLARKERGMVLVTGPTGSGKST
ncbi:MAG: Flp pilus assembly complex ATPase component TadA, partial [Bdellovibrionales bacterium]|nr:Flp pilus assembly complex ATPase component TadA [Bdellovibrionales bacterium]